MFIVLNALTPLEPRVQHTARICGDRLVAATSTEPVLSGGEVAAVLTPS